MKVSNLLYRDEDTQGTFITTTKHDFMQGIKVRVFQVWFQNARAKWRRNVMRQQIDSGGDAVTGDKSSDLTAASLNNDVTQSNLSDGAPPLSISLQHEAGSLQNISFRDIY